MRPSRNSPCPCGSGRKYKHCCLPRDRESEAERLPGSLRAAAAAAPYWEADLAPFALQLKDDPEARPAAALVGAAGALLHADILPRPGGELADVAAVLEAAVQQAAREVGVLPAELRVRHAELAEVLAPRLAPREVRVVAYTVLPDLDEAASALHAQLARTEIWPVAPFPQTWAGWGLPAEAVAEIFRAAAAFYRSAPWRALSSDAALEATFPADGGTWTVSVLGQSEGEPGLALYSEVTDFEDTLAQEDPAAAFSKLTGRVLALNLESRSELPRPMQREVAAAGWEVASPDAYPLLLVMNSPGGGMRVRDAAALAAVLDAVPRFVEAMRFREPPGPGDPTWEDGVSGVRFRISPAGVPADEWHGPGSGETADRPPEWLQEEIEAIVAEAEAAGVRPDVEYLNARLRQRLEAYNDRPQQELGGLSPRQAHALLMDDWSGNGPLRLAADLAPDELAHARLLQNARTLLTTLLDEGPLPHTQAGNLPLRFVELMLDRLDWGEGLWSQVVEQDRDRRQTEQELWPLHILRVVLETAGLMRKYRRKFEVTRRGRALLARERMGELYVHLFRTMFRKFNLDYESAWGEAVPELQHTLSLTLWRIAREAEEWRSPAELAERVLPPELRPGLSPAAREPGGSDPAAQDRAWAFDHRIVEPLVDFGLLERRFLPSGKRSIAPHKVRKSALFDRFLRWST